MSLIETIIDVPAEHERKVCGQFDCYLKKIERTLHVSMIARDGEIKIIGPDHAVKKAKSVFSTLIELSKRGEEVGEQNVDYALSLAFEEKEDAILEIDTDIICRTITGKPIKPKTLGQKTYVDEIRDKMIVFGLGPAGTGKTYLAMAMAITAFKNNEVGRIILTRPAIEAGEKLGEFLDGVEIGRPEIPYVANVTASYVTEKEEVKDLLAKQVSSSVRWEQSVRAMLADGVDTFIEIGPGKTLAGFIKKITRDVKVINIETLDGVKALKESGLE